MAYEMNSVMESKFWLPENWIAENAHSMRSTTTVKCCKVTANPMASFNLLKISWKLLYVFAAAANVRSSAFVNFPCLHSSSTDTSIVLKQSIIISYKSHQDKNWLNLHHLLNPKSGWFNKGDDKRYVQEGIEHDACHVEFFHCKKQKESQRPDDLILRRYIRPQRCEIYWLMSICDEKDEKRWHLTQDKRWEEHNQG